MRMIKNTASIMTFINEIFQIFWSSIRWFNSKKMFCWITSIMNKKRLLSELALAIQNDFLYSTSCGSERFEFVGQYHEYQLLLPSCHQYLFNVYPVLDYVYYFYCHFDGFVSYLNSCAHLIMLMMISVIRCRTIRQTSIRKWFFEHLTLLAVSSCTSFGLAFVVLSLFIWINIFLSELVFAVN